MLKQRIITAVILAAATIAALFYADTALWQSIVLAVAIFAAWEWAALIRLQKLWSKVSFVILASLAVMMTLLGMPLSLFLVLVALQLSFFIAIVLRYQRTQASLKPLNPMVSGLMGIISIVVFCYALFFLREAFSPILLLLAMLPVWLIDSGAYFSGRKFGKTKLAVHVSPGKTWEGVWGGALLTFVVILPIAVGLAVASGVSAVLLALVLTLIALTSVFGDLYESVLKRQAEMKDSGNLLPGHGGILDRVDSLIVALPLTLVVWSLWPSLVSVSA